VERPIAKRPLKIFERLLDSDVKADLLMLFHNDANLTDTPEGLAKRIGHSPVEVQHELNDLIELGILQKIEVYSFGLDRDREIQDAISKQLALSENIGTGGLPTDTALEVPRFTSGLEIIDSLLPEGLPVASTLLILSDPGGGDENILAHFVNQQIEAGKSVLYIALDNFPPNIRRSVQTYSKTKDVDWSSLIFVDCYSKTVGVESDEPSAVDPENLSAISIAISDIMSKATVSLIVLDSFNTLIRKRGGHSAIEFLRLLVARTRQAKCVALVTMNRKAFHPAIAASAEDIVEGVIELKVEESEEGIEHSLRVFKMLGTKHSTAWIRYEISEERELVSVSEK
jgi:KaiC/GvpD/RAD55 family RecA-like ATPase